MQIDPNRHVPIYEQIADSLRAGIAAGIYRPGEMLPSLRRMALDVVGNPNTVQRAYEALEREGLVYSRKGLGLFVTKGGITSARAKSKQAVASALRNAIQAACEAGLGDEQVRRLFEDALEEADEPTRRTE
jgi:GntR family transcriptional regulator